MTIVPIFQMLAQNSYGSVKDYLTSISTSPIAEIIDKCDALIASGTTEKMQADIAGVIFDYFTQSPVMGVEAVSVYIADNYFLNKRLKWPNEATYPTLWTYAEFNRKTLLGQLSPELSLKNIEGGVTSLHSLESEYKIVYFFDTQCSSCAKQTSQLVELLREYRGSNSLALYAVYTDSNRDACERYIKDNMLIENLMVDSHFVWDPEQETSYHMDFGVFKTPTMLLLNRDNIVVGRALDVEALSSLLGIDGKMASSLSVVIETIESELGSSVETFISIAESLSERTIKSVDDYNFSISTLYDYLRRRNGRVYTQAADSVARNYILHMEQMWSKQYIERIESDLYYSSLNSVGEVASDLSLSNQKGRTKSIFKYRGKKGTVLFFNILDCEECQKYKDELYVNIDNLRKRGLKVLSIYVGPFKDEWGESVSNYNARNWVNLRVPDDAQSLLALHTRYYLTTVPKIYLLDKKGVVVDKELTPQELLFE